MGWDDADLASARVTFAGGVADGDNGIVVRGTKTDRVYRVTADAETIAVPLPIESDAKNGRRCAASGWPGPDSSSPTNRRPRNRGARTASRNDGAAGATGQDSTVFDSTTSLNVYSHFVDSGDQAAAETIGGILADSERLDGQGMAKPASGTGKAESVDPA